jgi:diguanylate cyclase (GGDEF)-like protein
MNLLGQAIKKIAEGYEQLATTYEKMVATEDELLSQKEKLQYLAYYDSLTGLINRVKFEQKLASIIKQDDGEKHFTVLLINIDNFKNINNTLGHSAGDNFLQFIADKFKGIIEPPNIVARTGGDEFTVLIKDKNDKENIIDYVMAIKQAVGDTWIFNGYEFYISLSIGITQYPEDGVTVTDLYRNASIAMHKAKQLGKNCYVFFTEQIKTDNLERIGMVNQLKHAIENQEFVLMYQPQFNLVTGEITGVEALIRWLHPEQGFISPAEFIPLAEETGQIYEIERWVFNEAIRQMKLWDSLEYPPIEMSVNLSSKSLTSDFNFFEIEEILNHHDFNRNRLVVEITETAIISDVKCAIKRLQRLRESGIRIALDDFGTGYSSLTYLKELPIDLVKLDCNFIKFIENEGIDCVIVKSIMQLSHDLSYQVVAEGVETSGQLECLIDYGCKSGQGYYFSKPIKVEELERRYFLSK